MDLLIAYNRLEKTEKIKVSSADIIYHQFYEKTTVGPLAKLALTGPSRLFRELVISGLGYDGLLKSGIDQQTKMSTFLQHLYCLLLFICVDNVHFGILWKCGDSVINIAQIKLLTTDLFFYSNYGLVLHCVISWYL